MVTDKELLATLDMWENMEESQRLGQLKFLLSSKRNELKEKINNIIIDLTDEMGRISYYILQRELDKIFEGEKHGR